eukprot:GHVO01012729.1.p1 GENE.GHVO01012729.1~~GHVO01012729.1.p1  ORF type:complete len:341 (+),score=58.06 GHVO01012729.1:86-1108(+)
MVIWCVHPSSASASKSGNSPNLKFEIKYVRWSEAAPTVSNPPSVCTTAHLTDVLPSKAIIEKYADGTVPTNVVWEGAGSQDNRVIIVRHSAITKVDPSPMPNPDDDEPTDAMAHVVHMSTDGLEDGSLALPPVHFIDPQGVAEYVHTTRYYKTVAGRNEIEYDNIIDRVWVGTCPRHIDHLRHLAKDLKISTVINYQTNEDLQVNWMDVEGHPAWEGRTPGLARQLCAKEGMTYIHFPTTDMDTDARAAAMATSAWIVHGLLNNPNCTGLYIHCNAGVGRSIASVCGYLRSILNLPVRVVNLFVCARRPVAFFDQVAVRQGHDDFIKKFGEMKEATTSQK